MPEKTYLANCSAKRVDVDHHADDDAVVLARCCGVLADVVVENTPDASTVRYASILVLL